MSEIEINDDSHIVTSQEDVKETEVVTDAREAFGLPPKEEQASDDAEHDEEGRSVNEPPAKEEEKAESKKITVKYNKEEIEVPEDQIPDLVEKGMNLDKVRNQKNEYEKALDEAAKLLGLKDHTDFLTNRERLFQEQQQQVQDQFEQAKKSIIEQLVYSGVDEQTAREYAENNPLVQQARASMEREQLQEQERQIQLNTQQRLSSWDELYKAFPDIVAESDKFNKSERPDFFTPEMERMYNAGYKPLDAFRLAHLDKIQTQSKKATEQKVIKQQMLGQRAQVEGNTPVDNVPQASEELRGAFSAFGLDPGRANKYAKKAR